MTSRPFLAYILSIGLSLAISHGYAQGKTPSDSEFFAACNGARVGVHADKLFRLPVRGGVFLMAPAASWDSMPAATLKKGVTFAVAYIPGSRPGRPAGYYALKAFADDVRVGVADGRVQLVDRSGRVAGTIPAQIMIHSLTVPPTSEPTHITTFPPGDATSKVVWAKCKNGQCVRVPTEKL